MNEKNFKDKNKMVNLISFWQARPKENYGEARYLSGVQLVISMNMTRIIKNTYKNKKSSYILYKKEKNNNFRKQD